MPRISNTTENHQNNRPVLLHVNFVDQRRFCRFFVRQSFLQEHKMNEQITPFSSSIVGHAA